MSDQVVMQGCQSICKHNGPEAYKIKKLADFNEDGILYWHMVNYNKDMGTRDQLLTMVAATTHWNKILKDHGLLLVQTSDISKADIKVYAAVNGRDGNAVATLLNGKKKKFKHGFNKGVLGWYHDKKILLNDAEYFTQKYQKGSYHLETFYIHEWGHALGFSHTHVREDIMGDTYNEKATITQDSIDGLEEMVENRYGTSRKIDRPEKLVDNDFEEKFVKFGKVICIAIIIVTSFLFVYQLYLLIK